MEKNENAKISICTAPPGLYAVIKNMEGQAGSDAQYAMQVVTAFKYTYYGDGADKVFSEPIVYCESKEMNALIDGKAKIEFVGSHENCLAKIKEMNSKYYAEKTARGENQ